MRVSGRDAEGSSWLWHAAHLLQGTFDVGEVKDRQAASHHIESIIFKLEMLGVHLLELDILHLVSAYLSMGKIKHPLGEVDSYHFAFAPNPACERESQATARRGNIKADGTGRGCEDIGQTPVRLFMQAMPQLIVLLNFAVRTLDHHLVEDLGAGKGSRDAAGSVCCLGGRGRHRGSATVGSGGCFALDVAGVTGLADVVQQAA